MFSLESQAWNGLLSSSYSTQRTIQKLIISMPWPSWGGVLCTILSLQGCGFSCFCYEHPPCDLCILQQQVSLQWIIRSSIFTLLPECSLQHCLAGIAKQLPFLDDIAWFPLDSKANYWLLLLAKMEEQTPDYPPSWNKSNKKKNKIYSTLVFQTLDIRHWKIVILEK